MSDVKSVISIIYFSGYGHTKVLAETMFNELQTHAKTAYLIAIDADGNIKDEDWQSLANSHAIVFGAPTYMGNAPWQFKKFADASSKPWFGQLWKDKIAAGFTNSASMNGDKSVTLNYLWTLSQQHSMIWVGTGLMPSNSKAAMRNDINYLGSMSGLMAQSPSDASPQEGPLPGDLATAKQFIQRIAQITQRFI